MTPYFGIFAVLTNKRLYIFFAPCCSFILGVALIIYIIYWFGHTFTIWIATRRVFFTKYNNCCTQYYSKSHVIRVVCIITQLASRSRRLERYRYPCLPKVVLAFFFAKIHAKLPRMIAKMKTRKNLESLAQQQQNTPKECVRSSDGSSIILRQVNKMDI